MPHIDTETETFYIDENGKKQGKYIGYYVNIRKLRGQTRPIITRRVIKDWNYVDDKLHGEQLTYATNGDLLIVEHYEMGILHGIRSTYRVINGSKYSDEEYDMGVFVKNTIYYHSGKKYMEDDKKKCTVTHYYDNSANNIMKVENARRVPTRHMPRNTITYQSFKT